MLQGEHFAILLTFIKLPFVFKIFVLSIFEWLLKTGFTVYYKTVLINCICIKPPVNVHADVSSRVRGPSLYLHPYLVYTDIYKAGSCESVHFHKLVWAFATSL